MTPEQLKEIKERCEERPCDQKHRQFRFCNTCLNTNKLKPKGATVEETKALIAEIERLKEIEWMYNDLCK